MSLKKSFVLLAALFMVFAAACGGGDEVASAPTITLPAAIWSSITNGAGNNCIQLSGAGDWVGMVPGDPYRGVGAVADPFGSDTMYIVVVPALINAQTHVMTNTAQPGKEATWVPGTPWESINSAQLTMTATWFNDYAISIGGPAGNANANPADRNGSKFGQPTMKTYKVLNGLYNGNDVYVAVVSKVALSAQAGAWGVGSTNVAAKLFAKSFADNNNWSDTTVGYASTPGGNFGFKFANIPDWIPSAAIAVAGTLPLSGQVHGVGEDIVLTFSEAPTNVTAGKLPAGITFILSNVTTGTAVANNGSNFDVTVSGNDVIISTAGLLTAGNVYNLTFNGFIGPNAKPMNGAASITGFTAQTLTTVTVAIYAPGISWTPTKCHFWNAPGAFPTGGTAWPGVDLVDDGDGWWSYTMDVYISGTGFSFIMSQDGADPPGRIQRENCTTDQYYGGTPYGNVWLTAKPAPLLVVNSATVTANASFLYNADMAFTFSQVITNVATGIAPAGMISISNVTDGGAAVDSGIAITVVGAVVTITPNTYMTADKVYKITLKGFAGGGVGQPVAGAVYDNVTARTQKDVTVELSLVKDGGGYATGDALLVGAHQGWNNSSALWTIPVVSGTGSKVISLLDLPTGNLEAKVIRATAWDTYDNASVFLDWTGFNPATHKIVYTGTYGGATASISIVAK